MQLVSFENTNTQASIRLRQTLDISFKLKIMADENESSAPSLKLEANRLAAFIRVIAQFLNSIVEMTTDVAIFSGRSQLNLNSVWELLCCI